MLIKHGMARVVFTARGPIGLSFAGMTEDVHVTEQDGMVTFTVPLITLETGIWFRDKHMRERYLETAKYPVARLQVARSDLIWPANGPVQVKVKGKLTLHGVTRAATVSYEAQGNCHFAQLVASMHINMKVFKIETPEHLGMKVRPGVNISLKMGIVDPPSQ
jgi:polyisoprenoid-binding protein YceI